jgi:UDP-N-acetylglucosamine 2-epimerase (non-hydrolysing)
MDSYEEQISATTIKKRMSLSDRRYFVVTMHRAENVDNKERLASILQALDRLYREYGFPIICSLHPRTRGRAKEFGLGVERKGIRFVKPLGFFDFVALESKAFCMISDSGTVQEEACILGVPNVTIRDVTERPETLECGSNILAGCDPLQILESVRYVVANEAQWAPPAEYLANKVASTVVRIVMGFRPPDRAELAWQQNRTSRVRRK